MKARATIQKELIDKANEIIMLIEKNERAVEELEKYAESGKTLYTDVNTPGIFRIKYEIDFEPWEIRLMIHNKKQRIKALKAQLERM